MKFQIFLAAILVVIFGIQSNAQTGCVGVHVSQWWNCENGSASATAYPVGGTAPYTYNWSNGSTNQTVTDLTPGQYYITVTDASGCLHVETCLVVHPECCLWVNWNATPDNCQLGGQGSITISEIGGGVPPYTVILPNGMVKVTNGNTPIIITGLEAGDYFIPVTDSKGCTLEEVINVPTTNGPTATISLATIACGQTNTTANVSVTGGTTPYTYLWDNGVTTASAVLNAGTHNVTVTDKNGCTATATTLVSLPQPPVVSLLAMNTICGDENGGVASSVTGGTTPYTYNWSNGATTQNLTNVPAGAYTLTVTGANSCSVISFAIVLPGADVQDLVFCDWDCDSVEIYGIKFFQTKDTMFIENVNGCPRTVKISAIILTTGATLTEDITACYGTTVTVNGVNYTNDATITTTGTGNCPGQVVWNIEFTTKPDTFPVAPVKVCGLVDTSFTYPVSYLDNGCVDHVLLHSVQVEKVQQEIAWAPMTEQCGLVAKVDTLYKGMMFNQATCTLTTTLQELVTNPIQQEIVWGLNDTICSTVASTREILDGITVVSDSCTQLVYKHLLVTVPYVTDTVTGPSQNYCGVQNETFLAFDGESVDGCNRTLSVHLVNLTEWQTVSVYGPEVHFCGDTSKILINFDGRKIGPNCTDTTFLHRVVIEKSTQDTTWNTPVEICGFVTGTYVVADSSQAVGCHTQVFLKKVTVKPIFLQEVIGDTVSVCGLIANSELVPDSVVTDTANCIQIVFKHWEVTYPIATSSQQATVCANDSYVWNRNGKVYTEPGVYTDTTTTVDGCPDIATLFLTELPLAYSDTTVYVCPGQFYQHEGNMFGEGEEEFHYVSNNGCDSTFVLFVKETKSSTTINFPGNVVLNLPAMSQQVIDALIATTAAGDTITLLGAAVNESLVNVNDSLWVQTWNVITPCDTIQRSRTIMVLQPSIPPNTCDVKVLHDGTKNPVRIIISDIGDPQKIRYTLINSSGMEVSEGSLNVGFNEVQVSNLQPGVYYIQIRGNVVIDGERKPQILKDTKGNNAWCIRVPE